MKILFLGDIVGKPGRHAVRDLLPGAIADHGIDLVIANAENAAGGSGLTAEIAQELIDYGIDGLTLGDHVWDQKGFAARIGDLDQVCRPLNLPTSAPGRGHLILTGRGGVRTGVLTLLGKEFMRPMAYPMVEVFERFMRENRGLAEVWMVEIHAEATSEKVAMGWFLDGKVAAVLGTHTHIPTADARVLPKGTAYLTDLGMSGPYTSVLGREVGPILAKLKDGIPRPFPVATEDVRLSGALVEVDPINGGARSIERFEEKVSEATGER
ncbi:MAG: YmdB family metallophosphoesterase [Puniceicoccaceae bacterium]